MEFWKVSWKTKKNSEIMHGWFYVEVKKLFIELLGKRVVNCFIYLKISSNLKQ